MKKSLVCLLLLFLIFSFVSAEDVFGIKDNLDENVEKLEETKEKIEGLKDTDTNYFAEKWKGIFRNNLVTETVDKGFSFLSPVFKILIQEPYSLSWRFFIILIIWIFVFWNVSKFFNSLLFQNLIGWGIGFVTTFILSYFGFFHGIYDFLSKLIIQFSGWQKYAIIGVIIFGLFILQLFNQLFAKYAFEQKKKSEKEKEKFNRWVLDKITSIYKKDL